MPPIQPNNTSGTPPLNQFAPSTPSSPVAETRASSSTTQQNRAPVGAGTGAASRAASLHSQAAQTLSQRETAQLAAFLGVTPENVHEIIGRIRFVDGDTCYVLETTEDDSGRLTEKTRTIHVPFGEKSITSDRLNISALPEEERRAVQDSLAQLKTLLHKAIKGFSPDETGAYVRARFEAQLNDGIDPEGSLMSAVALTAREANVRYKSIFAGQTSPEARQEVTIHVDRYLDYRASQRELATPPEVRNSMIGFGLLMENLQRTIGITTNFLTRKPDPIVSGHDGPPNKGEVNIEEMGAKNILQFIQNFLDSTLARNHNSFEKWMAVDAATSLVNGSATCDGYVGLLAFRISQVIPQLETQFNKIRLSRAYNLTISPDEASHPKNATTNKKVNHTALLVDLNTKDGNWYTLLLDPWSEINTPVLAEHISFMQRTGTINADVSLLNFEQLSLINIQNEIRRTVQLLPQVMKHPNIQDAAQRHELKTINHKETYSLANLAKNAFCDPEGASLAMRLPASFLAHFPSQLQQSAQSRPLVRWVQAYRNNAN